MTTWSSCWPWTSTTRTSFYHGPAERAERLEKFATREVDLHGWSVTPTPDLYGLAVAHGEYAVSLMFGRRLVEYVQEGSGPVDA